MTRFPVPAESVLSPLSDSLLQLMENDIPHLRDPGSSVSKASIETCNVLVDDCSFSRVEKISLGKSTKSVKSKVKSLNSKGDIIGMQNREISCETPEGRKLVTSAVDISKQTSSLRVTNETSERQLFGQESKGDCNLRESDKITSKVRVLSSGIAKDEPLVGGVSLGPRKNRNSGNESLHLKGKQNSIMSSSDQAFEGRTGQQKSASCDSPVEIMSKREKKCNASKSEADGLNLKMDANIKSDELTEEEEHQGTTLHGQSSEKPLKSKNQSPGARRKFGNQTNIMQSVESSFVPSSEKKKSSHSKMDASEHRKDSSGRQESNKANGQQCQNDGVDDAKSEKTVNISDLSENLFRDKGRDNKIDHDKVDSASADRAKEKVDVKNDQNSSTSEAFENGMKITPLAINGPTSHATPAPAALLVKEDWVCCDICQKWRLLPYGTNPDHLPKKWLCTMQDWLYVPPRIYFVK